MTISPRERARLKWGSPASRPRFVPVPSRPMVENPGELKRAWSPQPGPQTAAMACPIEDLFYGGARGGGKSDFLIGDFAAHAARYGADAHGILFRRTFSELEEVEKRALQVYSLLGWTYNQSKRMFSAPNGATLKLRYLLRNKDAANYQGHQYTWMAFDELGNWPNPEPIDLLWACLRSAAGVPCVRRCTGNPGGPGHLWVRARYVEPHPSGYQPFEYQPDETNPSLKVRAVYIPSTLDDNALLRANDPAYESRIAAAANGSKALWKAWRHGDWWSVVGAAFEEWRSDIHVQKYRVPADWRWAAGMDWGYASYGWFGLTAFGPEGRMYLRWEYYFRKKTPYEVGYQLGHALKRRRIPEFIALDAACFSTTYQGQARKSEAEEIQRGLRKALGKLAPPVVKAPKGQESRVVRKTMLHEALRFTERETMRDMQPWDWPRLQVHPDCANFIRTIPALPADLKDPEKVDTEAEDHPYDGFTYLLTARESPEVLESAAQDAPSAQPDRSESWHEMAEEWREQHAPAGAGGGRWSRHVPGED